MPDARISELTAAGSVADANEFAINEAGTSKKATASQLATYTTAELFAGITGVLRSDAGTLSADSDITDIVDAASTTVAGAIEIADQTEMEAGTATNRAVTPGRQHFHPSACKFWVKWTGNSTTMLASYNMTSIANTGTGDADGTIATDLSGADYAMTVTTQDTTASWTATDMQSAGINATAAGTWGVLCSTITDGATAITSLTHPDQWHVIGFGDI